MRSVAGGPGGYVCPARVTAAPRVAHAGHEPRLEPRVAARVAVDGVDGALGRLGRRARRAERAREHRLQR